MVRKQWYPIIFLFLATLSSCKKDTTSIPLPSGAKNISLTNLTLDGKALSYSYSNTSTSPLLVLTFSEPIDHSSAQSSINLNNGSVSLNFNFSHNDSIVTVQPANALNYFTQYTFQIQSQLTSSTQKQLGTSLSIKIITQLDPSPKFPIISDSSLLTLVQQQTLKYFYDFGHPTSGLARERDTSGDVVTIGGSGFGLMALIVGIQRGFISRTDGITRFTKIISFLEKSDRFHGAWPHWMSGTTGKVIPFSANDNGADLVETSYMVQGLLTVRQYLTSTDTVGNNMINRINTLWQGVEYDWFRQNNQQVLYWHWSPDKGWIMNFPITGYNEALIVYILAAASPAHTIPASVYQQGWAQNGNIKNGKSFYGYQLPVGQDYGGPLFFSQYSFLGFNPQTQDNYANYWTQNQNHALINYSYCVANPKKYDAYSTSCWGLTASDNQTGYDAQSPTNDNGTISPTAAISSLPYTPTQSMNAIKYFYYTLGDKMWGTYGFHDAFNISNGWFATSYLAIDQGPIIVMIENYRTGLLWKLFMSAPEIQSAKTKLGFTP